MGTLCRKWGPFGDPKTEKKGLHGDQGPQMGTHLGAVHKRSELGGFALDYPGLILHLGDGFPCARRHGFTLPCST